MTILVVGASGATGRLLVMELLNRGETVKAIVRSPESLPESLKNNDRLILIKASVNELTEEELIKHVKGCDAVASCLGHNPNLKGMFGHPRRLVTDTAQRLCEAIIAFKHEKPIKFVLMSTIAISNADLNEQISDSQKRVMGLLRLFIPPHVDNEKAGEYFRVTIGQNNSAIDWVAVRPSGLINEDKVTEYEIFHSPTGSAIKNPGKISRINVGHFMADLITDEKLWKKWKGQMPVIYNKSS